MSELLDNPPSPIQELDDEAPVQYFCKFTFAQFFTIMTLSVFTMGFMFYLGARYGNDYLRLGQTSSTSVASASISTIPGAPTTDGEKSDEMLRTAREALQQQQTEKLQGQVNNVLQNPAAYQQQLAQQPAGVPPGAAYPADSIPPSSLPAGVVPPGAVGPGTLPPGGVTPQMLAAQDQQVAPIQQAPLQAPVATVPTTAAKTASDRINEYEPQNIPVRPTPDDEPAAPAASKSAAGTTFSVQVAASQNVAEANQWVQGWRDRGYSAFLMVADLPDKGRWYRVRLGSFPSRDTAETFASQLKNKEQVDALAVQNE